MSIETFSLFSLVSLLRNCTAGKRRFCFILGAGISVQSGIPSGEALSKEWLTEYQINEPRKAKDMIEKLNINTDNPGEFYSEIYKERFSADPVEGYLYLQHVMDNKNGDKKNPSCGFYHLAKILTETDSNFVITTNFDSLIEDSISYYTNKRSQIIIHEYLAQYINAYSNVPIIVKIHRDLLFGPKSAPEDCLEIPEELERILIKVLESYTPIVIGYGGNDGSLMKLLSERIASEDKKLYWCYYAPSGKPSKKIKDVLEKFDTSLVPIDGFDEMMLLIGQKFEHEKGDKVIENSAKQRIDTYNTQFDYINKSLKEKKNDLTDTEKATSKAIETISERRIRQLSKAITDNNLNPDNYCQRGKNYHAIGKYELAVNDFTKALEINPNNAEYLYARCESYINMDNIDDDDTLVKALSDINKAIDMDKNNHLYYTSRAMLYSIMGKVSEAEEDEATARGLGAFGDGV